MRRWPIFPLMAIAGTVASAPPVFAKDRLEGEKILRDFVRCAVRGAPNRARAILATAPGSKEEREKLFIFLGDRADCMKRHTLYQHEQMRMGNAAVRGAIAERLYLDGYKDAPSNLVSADMPSVATRSGDLHAVADCAVRRKPLAADALVRSERLSSEEADAAGALLPSLKACAGGPVKFNGRMIHSLIAESLYAARRQAGEQGND